MEYSPYDVEVVFRSRAWKRALPEAEKYCKQAARAVLEHHDVARYSPDAQLSVLLTGDAELRKLNLKFRGKDKPTNVLAFPGVEITPDKIASLRGPLLLGDIALAYETVAREAEAQGKMLANHLRHLAVHAVMHLLGYDHETDGEARRMEALEARILWKMKIENPYLAGR